MGLFLAVLLAVQSVAANVERAVQDGIASGIYPGAVVVVGTSDSILLSRGYGHFTWDASSRVPDPGTTLFDLASLTKVMVTTPAIMLLAERGRVALRQPVATYLPGFQGDGKDDVTVRHLLEHRSGLRAFLPLDQLAQTPGEARQIVLEEPLRWRPGSRVEYSDLNAILLGWVVEAVAGESLESFAAREIFAPLEMHDTRFRPERADRMRTMPVGLWRGHVIAGEVHDQNAARLGGVAGHAGLYATGTDVARYVQTLLRRGESANGVRVFRTGTVNLFTHRGNGNRALGFAMRDTTETDNTGSFMSAASFGHTGYTGTSFWIDPVRGVFVILLTNRVFAPRTGRSISGLKRVRGAVADAVLQPSACVVLADADSARAAGC